MHITAIIWVREEAATAEIERVLLDIVKKISD